MFPLAQAVGHARYVAGPVDSHGNPTGTWPATVNVKVYGYGPPGLLMPVAEFGGTQVIQDLQIIAPKFPVDPRDRFVVGGITYEVEGEVGDWTMGPFGFKPGMVIGLKRVEGGR